MPEQHIQIFSTLEHLHSDHNCKDGKDPDKDELLPEALTDAHIAP